MKRLVIAAFALCAFASGAFAQFHPFEQTYGYQLPDRFKKKQSGANNAAAKQEAAEAKTKAKYKTAAKTKALPQQDYQEDKPKKYTKGPAELSGGSQPNISAVAPPKIGFANGYGAGHIVIDQSARKLYYVLSSSEAYQYPIAVGREGFTWTGTQKIAREVNWPDWRPPAEMLERKPWLPEYMTGGIRNPLGAKALYLGNTLYRIHGTNDASSIGQAASSGCIRMTNGHVVHLASIAGVGTTVHVLNKLPSNIARISKKSGNQG